MDKSNLLREEILRNEANAKPILRREAEICLWYFKKHIHSGAELIGSFGKGREQSRHS